MAKAIAFTMYPVTDVPRAVAFYEALGLTKGGLDFDAWVEFDIGGGTFGIGSFEQCGTPGTAQSLAIEVEDIQALRASLAARGIDVSEPHDLPNCHISMATDPDGNRVWLHQLKSA
ncbi:MAG: VOC family protein [Candidatus Eremiobacteraeota bacterium]|nr:VOC family protein [Candidatus Eremiobacteraeota bacterium]